MDNKIKNNNMDNKFIKLRREYIQCERKNDKEVANNLLSKFVLNPENLNDQIYVVNMPNPPLYYFSSYEKARKFLGMSAQEILNFQSGKFKLLIEHIKLSDIPDYDILNIDLY